jgi:hypothetical protein
MQVAMKGVRVIGATIFIMTMKVVTAIIPVVKVKVATPIVKAEEVVTTSLAIKVEVAEKKRKVKLPKLKMSANFHGLPSSNL